MADIEGLRACIPTGHDVRFLHRLLDVLAEQDRRIERMSTKLYRLRGALEDAQQSSVHALSGLRDALE